jgi:hypothetical protein
MNKLINKNKLITPKIKNIRTWYVNKIIKWLNKIIKIQKFANSTLERNV